MMTWRGYDRSYSRCINDAFDGPNFSVTFKGREYPFYLYDSLYGSVITSCSQKKQTELMSHVSRDVPMNVSASDIIDASDCTHSRPCSQRKPRERIIA